MLAGGRLAVRRNAAGQQKPDGSRVLAIFMIKQKDKA
jgi:hypothetical protein